MKTEGGAESTALVSGIGRGLDVDLIVETLGEIERVADGDAARGDLVGPDLEEAERGASVDGGKCAVDGVEAAGNFHAADARDVETGVARVPLTAEVDFGVGVEIHVVFRVGKTDVGEVAGDVARGEVEGAVERDGEMGEVAADAVAALEDVPSGEIGPAGHVGVFDVLIQPEADGLDARPAVLDVAEFFPGEVGEFVGVAVAAGERVAEVLGREFIDGHGALVGEIVVVGFRGDGDDGVVFDDVGACAQVEAVDVVAVAIDEFLRGEIGAEAEVFGEDEMLAVAEGLNVEEQRGASGDLVDEMATDAQGDVEDGRAADGESHVLNSADTEPMARLFAKEGEGWRLCDRNLGGGGVTLRLCDVVRLDQDEVHARNHAKALETEFKDGCHSELCVRRVECG